MEGSLDRDSSYSSDDLVEKVADTLGIKKEEVLKRIREYTEGPYIGRPVTECLSPERILELSVNTDPLLDLPAAEDDHIDNCEDCQMALMRARNAKGLPSL
jgi:hypothetical protein